MTKALKNNNMTNEEFDAIQMEMSDFRSKKREIQLKIRSSLNTEPDLYKLKKGLDGKRTPAGIIGGKGGIKRKDMSVVVRWPGGWIDARATHVTIL
jgi:hypothetical protein